MDKDIAVDVTVTLDDQVQFNEHILDRPEVRRRRLIRWALVALLSPPLGLIIGILIGWLTSGSNSMLDVQDVFESVSSRDMLLPCIVISGLLLAVALLIRLFRPYLLRRMIRRLLMEREGVDPNDPQLRERVRCRFDDTGFSSTGAASHSMIGWAQVRSLDETKDVLVVRTGTMSGFLLPKRDLSVQQIAAIRAIVAAHKVPRDAPSGPIDPVRIAT